MTDAPRRVNDCAMPPVEKPSLRYFNRELSWLQFNTRVLEEAQNPDVPLMERLRFLSISASNLDEFYMVRVAGLRTQDLAGLAKLSSDGMTPRRQLVKISKQVDKITRAQDKCWTRLRSEMKRQNIRVRNFSRLSDAELETVRQALADICRPRAAVSLYCQSWLWLGAFHAPAGR